MSEEEHEHMHGTGGHDHGHDHDHDHDHDDAASVVVGPTPEHGYWRSMRELEGKGALQTQPNGEFAPGSDQAPKDPLSRRNFFQLMGASMAFAGVGLAGCRRYEKEEIVPLSRRPEDQTPGQTLQYATAYELGGVGHALIATSYEGRPIHLDGNPEHPYASGGVVTGTERRAGAHTFAQASILHVYDPDRSQSPMQGGKGTSLDSFRAALPQLRSQLANARILSEATTSPTIAALRTKLTKQFPNLQWHEYEPISWDNERAGLQMAFGHAARPLAKLDRCETIVTLDCDLFLEHPASMRYSRDFARSRKPNGSLPDGKINRLYSVESLYSNTGAMADHRLALRSELILPFAMELDARLATGTKPGSEFLTEKKIAKYVDVLVAELKANHGKSVVVAGRRQPPIVHALVARINQAIGAPGETLEYVADAWPERPSHVDSIAQLAQDLAGGKVPLLVILGGNPVYDAPADLDFAGALGKTTSIHLSEYQNETSLKASWHLPRAHFLEHWGDVRTPDGTITVAQPLIAPLYGGLAPSELLALLLGDERTSEALVRETNADKLGARSWRQTIHDGFIPETADAAQQLTVGNLPPIALTPSQRGGTSGKNGDLEVVYPMSTNMYDGRFANNAWLWETPDFLTKVTWDNFALVGPHTATALGLQNDTMMKVTVDGRSIELPCYVIPGQAKFTIGLVLGGGRTAAGRVGGQTGVRKSVGWDTYKVRSKAGFEIGLKASAESTGTAYELASIQEHWDIRKSILGVGAVTRQDADVNAQGLQERLPKLIRETTQKTLDENKAWQAEESGEFFNDLALAGNHDREGQGGYSLFKEKDYNGHRWGMAIDLSTCTGCNACAVACQSENNVPVVGRQEVINNREMSWMRIDRYFSGSVEEPRVVHQPVMCQQCEQAPCEAVCPVGATSHSDEGLNDMAYNRCIGTRYCANNCPYKVRRFNFLDWNKEFREARNKVRRLLFNPDVTVRMRGVMEKCTFCVQRIQNAKIKAKAQIRSGQRPGDVTAPLPDGEVETACQMACPTEAIVFGDLQDPNSRISRMHADRRSYALLPEMYTKPRNRYLARVHNPNLDLEAPTSSKGGHE